MTKRGELLPAPEPDYAVAPGETLRERLDELDMTQAELARRTGLTAKHVNQLVNGVASLSADVAQRLELVTGTPAYWWLRLEADYQATQMRLAAAQRATAVDISWADAMPVRALVRAGALPETPPDKASRVRQLLAFFGVASVDAYLALWGRPRVAFRQSHAYEIDEAAVSAWLRLGELAAQALPVEPFAAGRLRETLPQLRGLTRRPLVEALPEAVRLAAQCGVAVVFVADIAGTRAYGATRWTSNGRRPIVQLSLRGRTDDKLWETFFHELGHVLLHDRRKIFIEVDDDISAATGAETAVVASGDDPEVAAEAFARELIIPADSDARLSGIHTAGQVVEFADAIGIAPSLVVSRLHARRLWTYRQGADFKERVPDAAVQAASRIGSPDGPTPGAQGRTARRRQWHLPGEGT
jgi:HTH-type transcriptional regulator / antitoxin HigA